MEKPLDLLVPGDSVREALDALKRLVGKSKLRALIAQRRYERTKSQADEHGYMLASQEYYYAAALCSDFTKALAVAVAQQIHNNNEKSNKLN
jgi:hypothetical protein